MHVQEMPGGEDEMLAFLDWLDVSKAPPKGPNKGFLFKSAARWKGMRERQQGYSYAAAAAPPGANVGLPYPLYN